MEKFILSAPNLWCINNNLTKNKIYKPIITTGEVVRYPQGDILIINDIGETIEAPMFCFDELKSNRLSKIKKLFKNV